jgi:Fe-S-cluster-containing dehydrogenase component
MITWLQTTQHKINAGLALVVLALACFLCYGRYERSKADSVVQAAAVRAAKAVAIDSTKQAVIGPQIAKLAKEVAALKVKTQNQELQNILLAKKNENLAKQLDSLNGYLGMRPDF